MEIKGLEALLNYGAIGILALVCLYQVLFLQKQIFTLIKDNNEALQGLRTSINDLKNVIDRCQFTHVYGDRRSDKQS